MRRVPGRGYLRAAIYENADIDSNGSLRPRMHNSAQGRSCRALAMRDLAFILAPLAVILYFLVNQDQFRDLLTWVTLIIQ
jgi:hypothetical protein